MVVGDSERDEGGELREMGGDEDLDIESDGIHGEEADEVGRVAFGREGGREEERSVVLRRQSQGFEAREEEAGLMGPGSFRSAEGVPLVSNVRSLSVGMAKGRREEGS